MGVLTLFKRIDDKSKEEEGGEHEVKLVVAREDAAEEAFDLVASGVSDRVQRPGIPAIGTGRDYRFIARFAGQLEGFLALAGLIHDEVKRRFVTVTTFCPLV